MKLQALAFILALLMPLGLSAETFVRFADHDSSISEDQSDFRPQVGEGAGFFSTEYTTPSGDGTSEDAPGKVYVPVDSDTSTLTVQNQSHVRNNAINGLPGMRAGSGNKGSLKLRLDVKNDLGEQAKLYVAAKEADDQYLVFGRTSGSNFLGLINDGADSTATFTLELADICALTSDLTTACNNLNTTNSTSVNVMLYFFLERATQEYGDAQVIVPSSYNHGVFLQVFLSNRTHENSIVSLVSLKKGDSRLTLDYAGPTIVELFSVYAFYTNTVGDNPGTEFMSELAPGIVRRDLETTSTTQNYDLKDLTNGRDYEVSAAFVDKYGFATKTSNSRVGAPVAIEEFLKSQSCYLISAGFGEEHFVIEYFKGFRDHVLKGSSLGRGFIRFYYDTAPEYALKIYQHKWLAAIVRMLAYGLYFIFLWYGLPLLIPLFLLCLRYVYVKRKSDQPQ